MPRNTYRKNTYMNEEQYPPTIESLTEIQNILIDQIGQLRQDHEVLKREVNRLTALMTKLTVGLNRLI